MTSPTEEWQSLLEQQVADGTRNDLDLSSDRQYSPETHRVYRDTGSGLTRELLQYQDISGLSWFHEDRSGDEDVFVLAPAAGNTIQIRSAKLLRYSVSYVAEFTQAIALNQTISNSNDRLTIGLDTGGGDGTDGYFLEHRGEHDADEVEIQTRRAGAVIGGGTTVTMAEAITFFRRVIGEYAWYNIVGSKWAETTTTPGDVVESELTTETVEPGDSGAGGGGRGPISGTGRIIVELEADSSTSGLEAYVGSTSFKTLGNPTDLLLGKGFEEVGLSVASTGTYEPLFAVRKKPGFPNINIGVNEIALTDGPNGKLNVVACDPSNVLDGTGSELTDSDFSTPNDVSPNLIPIEVTDGATVNEFPDSSGTTVTSANDPGGYQLVMDISRATGTGSNTLERNASFAEDKSIADGEYAVVLGNFESTSSTIKVFGQAGIDQ